LSERIEPAFSSVPLSITRGMPALRHEGSFSNPLYNGPSKQIAVADRMLEAFEGLAREKLGGDTLEID